MHDQSSPIETPTTPSTPSLPLFAISPTLSHGRQTSISSIHPPVPARRCSSSLTGNSAAPASPVLDIPILRPLPLRPALQPKSPNNGDSNSHRVRKPSQQHHLSRRGGRSGHTPPPDLHTISRQRATPTPLTYSHAVSHLSSKLIPLISVTTGLPHPAFPRSLLQYHLLTHAQLDELAVYYHQVAPPVRETAQYPVGIPAWVDRDGERLGAEAVGLETKRRRWGRFLGLRGCESPVGGSLGWEMGEEERRMRERLEREWRRALERRRDEERLRGKVEGWREKW